MALAIVYIGKPTRIFEFYEKFLTTAVTGNNGKR